MKKKKILMFFLLFLIIFITIGFIFVNVFLSKVNYTDWSNTTHISEEEVMKEIIKEEETNEDLKDLEEVKPEDVIIETVNPLDSIPNISNILLVGEENYYNDARGRTDSMMILTIDKINGTLKLTSIMRDSYVTIPNYQDNRINAAYAIGGIPLLKETIETNYGITIDNTALVNFEAFQKIIDILGGVDIELTAAEAKYLNSNNYIKEEENRNVIEGVNHFNGSQALGYARIRKVKEIDGESNDFGRTSRQRRVLSTLFDEYKSASLPTLLELANKILPYITTDMSKDEIIDYITAIVFMAPDEIETFRLPIDNGYTNVSIRGMSVLQIDWETNRNALKEFIYGIDLEENTDTTNTESINMIDNINTNTTENSIQ